VFAIRSDAPLNRRAAHAVFDECEAQFRNRVAHGDEAAHLVVGNEMHDVSGDDELSVKKARFSTA
jgi:hypothetical protein